MSAFDPLPDVFRSREKAELAEERLLNARAKLNRIRTSPQGPTDPVVIKKAMDAVATAERAMTRARADLARFGARW